MNSISIPCSILQKVILWFQLFGNCLTVSFLFVHTNRVGTRIFCAVLNWSVDFREVQTCQREARREGEIFEGAESPTISLFFFYAKNDEPYDRHRCPPGPAPHLHQLRRCEQHLRGRAQRRARGAHLQLRKGGHRFRRRDRKR